MYAISKILEAVFQPGNFLVLLVLAGTTLQWFGRQKLGLYVVSAGSALLLAVLLIPLGTWLMRPIEDRFARPAFPQRIDGIVVLGGGLNAEIVASRGVPSEDNTEGRIIAAVQLARLYPRARIVFSGGSGALLGDEAPEAQAAKVVFAMLGISGNRLVLEDKSRNTWENILYSRRLAAPKPGEVWVLATSASQMPRAMAIATHLHWNMLAWPTDYATPAEGTSAEFDVAGNLTMMNSALHEWLGMIGYRLLGRL